MQPNHPPPFENSVYNLSHGACIIYIPALPEILPVEFFINHMPDRFYTRNYKGIKPDTYGDKRPYTTTNIESFPEIPSRLLKRLRRNLQEMPMLLNATYTEQTFLYLALSNMLENRVTLISENFAFRNSNLLTARKASELTEMTSNGLNQSKKFTTIKVGKSNYYESNQVLNYVMSKFGQGTPQLISAFTENSRVNTTTLLANKAYNSFLEEHSKYPKLVDYKEILPYFKGKRYAKVGKTNRTK